MISRLLKTHLFPVFMKNWEALGTPPPFRLPCIGLFDRRRLYATPSLVVERASFCLSEYMGKVFRVDGVSYNYAVQWNSL